MRAHERIAAELRELGLDARPIDGWVYVALADDAGVMCISAEYGASLDFGRYPLTPSWFVRAPTDCESPPKPSANTLLTFQSFLYELAVAASPRPEPSIVNLAFHPAKPMRVRPRSRLRRWLLRRGGWTIYGPDGSVDGGDAA